MKSFSTPMKVCALLVLLPVCVFADDAKVRKAIEDGILTSSMLQTLTAEDVPDKWKSTKSEKAKKDYLETVYSRGDEEILTVVVPNTPPKGNPGMFVATVKIAKVKVVSIIKLSDSLNVVSHNKDTEYEISVSRKDDGRMRVLVTSKNGLADVVEIDGAQTRLMDDLEFTKAMTAQENIVGPLMDSIKGTLNSEKKKNP